MASSPLHPSSETPSSYKPSLEDFSPSEHPPMSNLTRLQWDDSRGDGEQTRHGLSRALASWEVSVFPWGRREKTSVLGPLGSRQHLFKALNPTSAPQNSPKVSGPTWGVGQLTGNVTGIGFKAACPENQDTEASASTQAQAFWWAAGPRGQWQGAWPSCLTSQLGVRWGGRALFPNSQLGQ